MSDKSGRVTDGYCTVEQLGAGGVCVKIHALMVQDGELDPGDHPDLVNAVCTSQLPRPYVKQDRSWEALVKMSDQGDLAGQPPLCKVCKATAGIHRVYGGVKDDPMFHLVRQSAVNAGDWTAIDGYRVDSRRGPFRWGEGDSYCCECDKRAGDEMRAQMASEEAERDYGMGSPGN
jgi:hypothetical protein